MSAHPGRLPWTGVAGLLGVPTAAGPAAVTGPGRTEATPTGPLAPPAAPDLAGRDLAGFLGLSDLVVVHAGRPQAQGDVVALPWHAPTAPSARAQAVRGARPVPRAGWPVLTGRAGHAHTLLADGPGVLAGACPYGLDLAVLVVPAGSVAVLAHEVHPDLHLGEGVYTLRRQRRHTPAQPGTSVHVED